MRTLTKHSWLAWMLLGCSLLATVLVSGQVKRNSEIAAQRHFAFVCDQVTLKIHERLNAYALILRGAAGLFAASGTVSRQEWQAYVETLHAANSVPGVQGIGFAALISPEQLAAHTAAIRAEGFPDYSVRPAGERAIYSPIVYLEPFTDRNLRAFGYDMFSEPVRRAAMEQARDTGGAALSGKVVLVQETSTDVQAGALMYFPVYRHHAPLDTVAQRQAAVLGWTYSPYRLTDLMIGILGNWSQHPTENISLNMYDGGRSAPELLLFHSHTALEPAPDTAVHLQQERTLEFNGHQWLLVFTRPLPATEFRAAGIALAAGTALSVLLFGLTLSLLRTRASNRTALQLTAKLRRREQALQDSEFRWRFALESAGDGLMDWNLNDGTVFYSDRWKQMLGCTSADIGTHFGEWETRIHPEDRALIWETMQAHFCQHSASYACEYRMKCQDGSWKCVLARGMAINHDASGKAQRMLIIHTDITERRRATEQLQLAANVFIYAREGIMVTTADGTIVDVNEAFSRITGYHHDEVIGRNPRLLKSHRQTPEFYVAMWRTLIEEGQWIGEIWNRRKNGEIYAQMQTISAVRNPQGVTLHYVSLFSDITAVKEYQNRLEHIAHYDALTSLPNRVLLAYRLEQAMAQAKRRQEPLAVVYLDLDGFKAINDNYGHEAGDYLLKAVAGRMKQNLRECDTLARLGGDEFVAVLVDLEQETCSLPMLTRLLQSAAQPVQFNGALLRVSASIGVTFYPQEDDINADHLLRQADQAMYHAKLAGKNRYYRFDRQHPCDVHDDLDLLEQLRCALKAQELVLHYQPQVHLRTGVVFGVAVQVYWQHPQRGWLSAEEFLALIEKYPLALEVTAWLLNAVFDQLAEWHRHSVMLPISLNLGRLALCQQALVLEQLKVALLTHPTVLPRQLRLELTEAHALDQLAASVNLIERCQALGMSCILDDFGAGYSTLTYLKRLAVPVLKINLVHFANVLDDPEDLAILNGTLGLAATFHREIIVDGVQTEQQGELLLQLGCSLAQGAAIGQMMTAEAVVRWVQQWQPPRCWQQQLPLTRDALPLLFASVGHRAWMRTVAVAVRDQRTDAPPLAVHDCHFGRWLDGEGAVQYGAHPTFPALVSLHQELHTLAQELLQRQRLETEREMDAVNMLLPLQQLQEQLLAHIQQLLKKSR
jgi:diguanylate cyclase (GGDEF)-like protein/PAS domain S-box-containing protein